MSIPIAERGQASPGHQVLPNDDRLETYLLHDAVVCQQLLFQVPCHQLRVRLPRRGGEAPAEPQPKDHGGGRRCFWGSCPAGERKTLLPAAAACAAGRAARRLTGGETNPPSSPPSQLGTGPFSTPCCQDLLRILAGFPSCSCSLQLGVTRTFMSFSTPPSSSTPISPHVTQRGGSGCP